MLTMVGAFNWSWRFAKRVGMQGCISTVSRQARLRDSSTGLPGGDVMVIVTPPEDGEHGGDGLPLSGILQQADVVLSF